MRSLDVNSLFANIPLEETIKICANTLFENTEKVGLSKIEFKELLSVGSKESYFPSKHLLVLKTSSRHVLKTSSTRLQRNNFSPIKMS